MIGRRHVVAAIAIVCGAAAAAQQPARDKAAAPAGTASLSGNVFVNGEDKRPARRVRVTLTNLAHASPGQTTTTGDNGVFVFRGVPAGRFELQAFKNGYLRSSYGASRPDRAGTPIVVKDGDAIANLEMTIAHGGVIMGSVVDMRGRPMPGVEVRVLRLGYNAVTGEATLSKPGTSSVAPTDDRGEYRAFGLPPGGYLVLANPSPASDRGGGPGVDDIRPLTSREVQQALQAARSGASNTPAASRPTTAPPDTAARVNFAPVFSPGVTDIAAAATIALGVSEQRTGVDVAIQLVPTATVSGTISSPSGALPQLLSVNLAPAGTRTDMLAAAGLRGLSTRPRPDGTYVIGGVPPGTYTLRASTGYGRGAPPNGPTLSAAADVTVSGQDLDVSLTLQPGVLINGRVVFEGSQPEPAALQALSFRLVAFGSAGSTRGSGGGGRVDAAGHFMFAGVTPDVYQVVTTWDAAGARDKWMIKSSIANRRDAFEAPLRVTQNEPLDWTVTFTDKPAGVAGVLKEPGGRPATDYYILVFSSDPRYWTPGSRRIGMTRPGTDGSYSVKGLPPGEYYLAAPTDLETGEWNDPVLLEHLISASARITLRDGEITRQDFRVGGA